MPPRIDPEDRRGRADLASGVCALVCMLAFASSLILLLIAAGAHPPAPLRCVVISAPVHSPTGAVRCSQGGGWLEYEQGEKDRALVGQSVDLYDGTCGAPDREGAAAHQPLSRRAPRCRRFAQLPFQLLAVWAVSAATVAVGVCWILHRPAAAAPDAVRAPPRRGMYVLDNAWAWDLEQGAGQGVGQGDPGAALGDPVRAWNEMGPIGHSPSPPAYEDVAGARN
jgi:hypothetical protein